MDLFFYSITFPLPSPSSYLTLAGAHPAPGVGAGASPSSLGAVAQCSAGEDLHAGPAGMLPKGMTRFALSCVATLPRRVCPQVLQLLSVQPAQGEIPGMGAVPAIW